MVLFGIVSVQVGAAFAKGLFAVTSPGGVVFLRLAVAALLVVAIVRPSARHLASRGAIAFGVCLAAMNWSFYEAIDRIPLGVAVTIEFVGPLGVAIAQSRRRADFAVAALAAAGILLLTRGGGGHLAVAGVLLALLAGTFWAGYILLSAHVGARIPGGSGLAVALIVGSIVTAPVGLVSLWGTFTLSLLGAGALVAVLSSVIPYSLELEALRRVPTGVFGVLMSVEPAMAALAGRVVIGEELVARQWVAICLVVLASAAASLRGPRDEAPHPD